MSPNLLPDRSIAICWSRYLFVWEVEGIGADTGITTPAQHRATDLRNYPLNLCCHTLALHYDPTLTSNFFGMFRFGEEK